MSLLASSSLPNVTATSFVPYWAQIFSTNQIQVIHATDGVQDDFAARVLLEAAALPPQSVLFGKSISLVTTVANIGFVSSEQAATNMLRLADLTRNHNIPIYHGTDTIEHKIVPPNYYGKDGLEDLSWPNVTGAAQPTPGYIQMASLIAQANPLKPVTILVTSPLTELAKAFDYLLQTDPKATFAQNINALVIRGGCIYPDPDNTYGCNAPYDVLDKDKNSEINFYSDPEAVQNVTTFCNAHNIQRILLPLGLTQAVLWTKEVQKQVNDIGNAVSEQLAKVLNIIPAPDARRFPADSYPLHDFLAAIALYRPDLFRAIKIAMSSVGDVGQIFINNTATEEQKLVLLLSLPEDLRAKFFELVLPDLNKFTCFLDPSLDICDPGISLDTILKIAIPAGAGSILVLIVIAFVLQRRRKKQLEETAAQLDEKAQLLDTTEKILSTNTKRLEEETEKRQEAEKAYQDATQIQFAGVVFGDDSGDEQNE